MLYWLVQKMKFLIIYLTQMYFYQLYEGLPISILEAMSGTSYCGLKSRG